MNKQLNNLKLYMSSRFGCEFSNITDSSLFPEVWLQIYNSKNKSKEFCKQFEKFHILPKFFELLSRCIKDVLFIENNSSQYMICVLEVNHKIIYYGGLNPKLSDLSFILDMNIPNNLKNFYTLFLNGFYDIKFGYLGFDSSNNIESIIKYDYSFLPEKNNLSNYYILFSNGSGCDVVVNKYTCDSFILYVDMEPDLDINFMDEIDDWMYESNNF